MRIAYHNPWVESSENQAYMSMAQAGRRIGIDLVACTDENDIEACRPDFVLAVASSVAKITDYPSYVTVHEPTALFIEQPERMRNLLSFDGYLTISDSLGRFIKDFSAGVGRTEEPGFCYLTPQTTDLQSDWGRPDVAGRLRVVYFGTNWNRRMPGLFRALDPMGILRIRGPEKSWAREGYASYEGPAAFDGTGPQLAYAEAGIGLALMDERWQREDVISNRIFEISSVGAVSICPDMPWTRKWFGDSVLYFDPDRPMREIAARVREHYEFCKASPETAAAMGLRARRIFETHFSAERLLARAVEYHERKTGERARALAAMPPAPLIAVVLRCGGRGLDFVSRAVDSIRRQSFGRFVVILAKYRDIDLSSITADRTGAVAEFREFLVQDGGRAEMLWAGVAAVDAPYFAVLDDDDFWLADHFEALFLAGRRVCDDFDMAFSGQIEFDHPVPSYYGLKPTYRNIGRFGFPKKIAGMWDIAAAIGTNCFVARRDLLCAEMLAPPAMNSAEDSLLIHYVSWRSKPIFSWRPTAFYRPHAADGSNWQHDQNRLNDEMTFAFRAGLAWSPRWLSDGVFDMARYFLEAARHKPGGATLGEQMDRLRPGNAGEKSPGGLTALPGVAGFVSEGPQAQLRPGRYVAVFLMTPCDPPDAISLQESDDPIGIAEIVVAALGGAVLGREVFRQTDAELEMRFAIDEEMVVGPVELRVFSYGKSRFTVASIGLYRDLVADVIEPAMPDAGGSGYADGGPLASPHQTSAPEAAVCHPVAELDMLRTEISAIKASASWRATAPLRRLAWSARRLLR